MHPSASLRTDSSPLLSPRVRGGGVTEGNFLLFCLLFCLFFLSFSFFFLFSFFLSFVIFSLFRHYKGPGSLANFDVPVRHRSRLCLCHCGGRGMSLSLIIYSTIAHHFLGLVNVHSEPSSEPQPWPILTPILNPPLQSLQLGLHFGPQKDSIPR